MTQKNINPMWLNVAVIAMVLLFVIAAHDIMEADKEVIPEGYVPESAIQDVINAVTVDITEIKDAEIAELQAELDAKIIEEEKTIIEEIKDVVGYLIDKLSIGSPITETISDRNVKTLIDSEVEFDGEDYDFEEVLELSDMKILVNEDDFEGTPYLVILKDAISYTVTFEESLVTSEILEEETLTFNFLGEEVEVIEWIGTSITFVKGDEFHLDRYEEKIIGENVITLSAVLENKVYVTVDGIEKRIRVGETARFNGLEVYVKEIDYADGYYAAALIVGEDIKNVIESGDDYSNDEIWKYVINSNSIGIILQENFKDLDDDEKPLAAGESLCLPNDYVCVRYDGFEDEDTEELTFELDDGFVEVRGDFQSGLNDYKIIFVNETTGIIYNKDDEVIENVTIGSSDVEIDASSSEIVIKVKDGNSIFELSLDLLSSNLDEVSTEDDEVTADYDVRTDFGIVVENPEDSIENSEWTIVVPYESLESTITVY